MLLVDEPKESRKSLRQAIKRQQREPEPQAKGESATSINLAKAKVVVAKTRGVKQSQLADRGARPQVKASAVLKAHTDKSTQ